MVPYRQPALVYRVEGNGATRHTLERPLRETDKATKVPALTPYGQPAGEADPTLLERARPGGGGPTRCCKQAQTHHGQNRQLTSQG